MGFFLLAIFIAWIMAELAAFSWVAGLLGTLDALVLVFLVSLLGAPLTKRVGLGAVGRIRQAQGEGKVPSAELADGALILAAGVLLVVPGFVSGAIGAALLLPPLRAGVRILLLRRFERRSKIVVVRSQRSGTGASNSTEVWDAESWEDGVDGPGPEDSGPSAIGGPR